MKRIKRGKILCILVLLVLLFVGCVKNTNVSSNSNNSPKYIFYFIGDGMGVSQRQVAQYYKQHRENDSNAKLLMNNLPVVGLVTTHSASSLVTDSAAAGTALAAGHKTNNSFISVATDGKTKYKTILEAAEDKGFSTGLITNTTVTDATPASFAAHVNDRELHKDIAAQYIEQDIEFIAGGGLDKFNQNDRNLIPEFKEKGYTIIETKDELMNTDMTQEDKVLALFELGNLPLEIDRIHDEDIDSPELKEMTRAGIEVLSKDEDGFFMMVEGGLIDKACHQNDLPSMIYEVLAFDEAIQVAYDFYLKHPNETLIIVVSDHETGGLGLGTDYSINVAPIDDATESVAKNLFYKFMGDRQDVEGLIAEVEGMYGIELSEEERVEFMNELSVFIEKGEGDYTYMYENFGSVISKLITDKTNIAWTSISHTAAPVPITAVGQKSNLFSGYKDNTEIAKLIAEIMKIDLN